MVEAEKAEDIEEAEELEDSKAEETGTQLQVRNKNIRMGLEEIDR